MAEVETIDGVPMKALPLVPRAVAVMEYAIKAAIGHKSVPKGGDPEYMNGPWYQSRGGLRIGDVMKKSKKKKYGVGAFADERCSSGSSRSRSRSRCRCRRSRRSKVRARARARAREALTFCLCHVSGTHT